MHILEAGYILEAWYIGNTRNLTVQCPTYGGGCGLQSGCTDTILIPIIRHPMQLVCSSIH